MTGAEQLPEPGPPETVPGLRARVALTGLALLWETLWQGFWQPVCALALFAALSLFDVWRLVPLTAHWLALLALLLFCTVTFYLQRGCLRLPARRGILARIERDNALPHHPLRMLEDRQELGVNAPEARELWRAHLLRIRQTLPRLRFAWPRPRAIRLDRHGLRQMTGILLIAGLLAAGPQWRMRVAAGFLPAGIDAAAAPSRLEAWITPPAYTGAAPVMLANAAGKAALEPDQRAPDAPVTVPAGSELSLRLFGGRDAEVILIPETGKKQRVPMTKIDNANSHASIKLERSLRAELRQSGAASQDWRITVIPDQPPLISLLEEAGPTRQFALRIKFGAADDYGVTAAAAEITLAVDPASPAAQPLRLGLPTPQKNAAKSAQTAYLDLTAHPWAGQPVRLVLIATDAAGQTGRTEPVNLILPQRPFNHPLARALIEQRRSVALDARNDARVIKALDALSLYPEKFIRDIQVYLAMRTARHGVAHAHGVADARGQAAEIMWRLAQRLEDGALPSARNELRALQQALSKALQEGASDEEIANLTQALREALDRYVQAMNDQAQEDEAPQMTPQDKSVTISKSDLEDLLNRMERLSRSGARGAAQEMLSKLQDILENMRPGQGGDQQSPAQKKYGEALRDIGKMMREQQQLQDETSRQQGGKGEGGGEEGLARSQDQLRSGLENLMGRLGQSGAEDAPSALGRAGDAMDEASRALRKGDPRGALAPQGQALDQLRAGAGALAKLLREEDARMQAGDGEGADDGAPREQSDPLGRPMANDSGGATAIPDQFDIERALQIRRELELRASQRRRPQEELDYIDRLLKLF